MFLTKNPNGEKTDRHQRRLRVLIVNDKRSRVKDKKNKNRIKSCQKKNDLPFVNKEYWH